MSVIITILCYDSLHQILNPFISKLDTFICRVRSCCNVPSAFEKKNNIQLVRQAFQAINTGDISKASEFISARYFNHESQMDPVRSKMRGPEEFIDTVKNLREAISEIRYEELETIASDSKIVSIVNVTGKHTGRLFWFYPGLGEQDILSSRTFPYNRR